MTSKTRLTLDLKDSQSFDTLILHRGDSKSRVIEIELTDNHAPVTLTSGMSATIDASTNGIVVADGEMATVDTANNIISFIVTDNMTSLPGQSKISLTVTEGDTVITAQTFRAIVTDSVINEGSKFEPTGGTVKQFMDEVASARGNFDNLNARFDSKSDKSTTLSGYGITDGENIGNKVADKSKITDEDANYPSIGYLHEYYYDFSEVDEALSGKLDNTEGSVTTDNIANKAVTNDKIANGAITALKIANGAVSGSNIPQNQIGTNHLQSGAVTADKLADEVKTIINSKYDSSNVETGSGELTVNTSNAEKIKSASFDYQKIGSFVQLNVYIAFNSFTPESLKSSITFLGLPFVCKNQVTPREMCVTSQKKQLVWGIASNTSALTVLYISLDEFVDGENLSFSICYKIL